MADMTFQSALQESAELSRQFAHGAGGEPYPLAPHKVQRQVEGPSGDGVVNKMNETAEMEMEFAIVSVIEYFDVAAAIAGLVLLL